MEHHEKRSTFSGKLGFVLSAAGASVGLGNICSSPGDQTRSGIYLYFCIYQLLE